MSIIAKMRKNKVFLIISYKTILKTEEENYDVDVTYILCSINVGGGRVFFVIIEVKR